jgi:hypothetical protein
MGFKKPQTQIGIIFILVLGLYAIACVLLFRKNSERGPQGKSGADGTNGTNGNDGINGPKGNDGATGTSGFTVIRCKIDTYSDIEILDTSILNDKPVSVFISDSKKKLTVVVSGTSFDSLRDKIILTQCISNKSFTIYDDWQDLYHELSPHTFDITQSKLLLEKKDTTSFYMEDVTIVIM